MTDEEKKAIKALQCLAKIWPSSLWLFTVPGNVFIMKKQNGKRLLAADGYFDRAGIIDSIQGIEIDGGEF